MVRDNVLPPCIVHDAIVNEREGKVDFGGWDERGDLLASSPENNALPRNLRRVGGGTHTWQLPVSPASNERSLRRFCTLHYGGHW